MKEEKIEARVMEELNYARENGFSLAGWAPLAVAVELRLNCSDLENCDLGELCNAVISVNPLEIK